MWPRVVSMFRALTGRQRFEDGLADEVRFHVEAYTEDLIRDGVPPNEAARQARLTFGNLDNVKDDCRRARGLLVFDELGRTLRHAIRVLRHNPSLTATALATLALCIGANLTVFAVVDAILLRPLPFPASDRLVRIFNTYPRAGVPDDGSSIANYYERRGAIAAFSTLAEYRDGSAIVGEPGATDREWATRISPGFFATLGLPPIAGREFIDAEMTGPASRVVVLTDAYWRDRLDATPDVLGRTIAVNGIPHAVVGVLPPSFRFLSSKARLYLPLVSSPEQRRPDQRHSGSGTEMIARLAPDTTREAAQAAIDAHNAAVGAEDPDARKMAEAGFRSLVVPLHADHVAAVRPVLLLVQAGAVFLLLIGAANLVNLLLIRATARARESAVRQAIGAGQGRLVFEAIVETTVLTFAGGILGLLVGALGTRLLAVVGTDRLPLGSSVAFDARVAAFALVAALVVGVAMGIPVAWSSTRQRLAGAMQMESRGATANRTAQRLRHLFVVGQVAMAFVLLSGTGLLAISLGRAMASPPGFVPEGVSSGRVSLPVGNYPDRASILAFTDRLVEALSRQPGVSAAGLATNVPLSGNDMRSAATALGYVPQSGESPRAHYSYGVAGDYFGAMRLSLVAGRYLTTADSHRPARVCVVDEDFVRWYWPDRPALGQQVFQGPNQGPASEAFTVVGVVGAVKQADLTEDAELGAVYYPLGERLDRDLYVVARTTGDPGRVALTLRRAVRDIDAQLPVSDVAAMQARIDDSLATRRSPALLVGLFAGLALLLTAIGTYGVLSYAVTRQRREIGLRMALGARPSQIRGQFVSLGGRLLAGGLLIGLAGAWAAGRAMQAVLFQVPALHAGTLMVAATMLAVVCLAACILPSRRAVRTSPMEALADE